MSRRGETMAEEIKKDEAVEETEEAVEEVNNVPVKIVCK